MREQMSDAAHIAHSWSAPSHLIDGMQARSDSQCNLNSFDARQACVFEAHC